MSALLDHLPAYRRMVAADLDAVMAIENSAYVQPWTRGNFTDSLAAGYEGWVMERLHELVGYGVVMIAAGEAHLLNLSIAVPWQRRGYGGELLGFLIGRARDGAAQRVLLEVRPSNLAGRGLYARAGFTEIATRRGYYSGPGGPEDAVVMELELK